MTRIGMLVAVEIPAILRRYGQAEQIEERGGFAVHRYRLEDKELIVVPCGAGELAAASAVTLLADRYGVELLVNFGVVGALTADMAQVQSCLAEKVVHYDYDLSAIDPVAPGQYPGMPGPAIPTTKELLERALALEPSLSVVTCASADKFVSGAAAKSELNRRWGAQVCDMEAAAVALICHRFGLPVLMIKTVADALEGGGAEYYESLQAASDRCLEITERIIRSL